MLKRVAVTVAIATVTAFLSGTGAGILPAFASDTTAGQVVIHGPGGITTVIIRGGFPYYSGIGHGPPYWGGWR